LTRNEREGVSEAALRKLDEWWTSVRSLLEFLVISVDVRRFAAFRDLGPIVNETDGGYETVYLSGLERITHTLDTANFALTFVLDTIVRLQDIERIPGKSSVYRLKVIVDEIPYFDVDDPRIPIGTLQRGAEIKFAMLGSGPKGEEWCWDDDQSGRMFRIDFDAAEIEQPISRGDYHRSIK
jgi:hypothetical protein